MASKTAAEMAFENAKRNYEKGLWTVKSLELAVKVGKITEAQKDQIINGAK